MTNQKARKNRIPSGWIFFGTMLLIYALIALLEPAIVTQSLLTFKNTILKILPILALVFGLMVIFNYILTPTRIKKYLGETSGLKGWLLVMVSGIFSTGPIYSWYILLGQLKQQGMKTSLIATFLYSRAIKLPVLPLLIHYFGLTYALILSFYLIGFSIVSGIIVGKLIRE